MSRSENKITYSSWQRMKSRCLNPKNPCYDNYGGRGVSIHQAWIDSFTSFIKDVGPRPSLEYSIDRIDPNGDYVPGNVKWSTKKEQQRNRRCNRIVVYKNVPYLLCELADKVGIDQKLLRTRLEQGMEVDIAVSKQKFRHRGNMMIEYKGVSYYPWELAEMSGISQQNLRNRIFIYGWDVERAISQVPARR